MVRSYLLLASSCDGNLATSALHTNIRVVCNNTLSLALQDAEAAIKVTHRTAFDVQKVKRQLGIVVSQWDSFMRQMRELAQRKVRDQEATNFIRRMLAPDVMATASGAVGPQERAMKRVQALFDGQGQGAGATGQQRHGLGPFESHHRVRGSRAQCTQQCVSARQRMVRPRCCNQGAGVVSCSANGGMKCPLACCRFRPGFKPDAGSEAKTEKGLSSRSS